MANHVTNRITLIGNKSIKQLAREINRRFMADKKKHKDEEENSSVGRVLYGLSGEDAELNMSTTGSAWVYVDGPWDENPPLRLISSWSPINGVQDFILENCAKLDPNVIVINEYSDESALFIGCRVVVSRKGKVVEFVEQEDTSNYTLVDEDYSDDDEENSENDDEQDDRDPDSITWDELWSMLDDLKINLIGELAMSDTRFNKEKILKMIEDM